jgi:hypothetical protein
MGCLTPQKMDAYVAEQYGNRLPQLNKKNTQNITVTSQLPRTTEAISHTTKKTSNVLPLIIYWHFEFRRICHLNPDIPVINFTNALNNATAKPLLQKLEGKKLELTVEQAPVDFSHTEKSNTIIIASWTRLYIEPDFKDLVVSYKLINAGGTEKTGKIQVKNPMRDKGFRLFQTWKSAISEYITEYNITINSMAKSFVSELVKEL